MHGKLVHTGVVWQEARDCKRDNPDSVGSSLNVATDGEEDGDVKGTWANRLDARLGKQCAVPFKKWAVGHEGLICKWKMAPMLQT